MSQNHKKKILCDGEFLTLSTDVFSFHQSCLQVDLFDAEVKVGVIFGVPGRVSISLLQKIIIVTFISLFCEMAFMSLF